MYEGTKDRRTLYLGELSTYEVRRCDHYHYGPIFGRDKSAIIYTALLGEMGWSGIAQWVITSGS